MAAFPFSSLNPSRALDAFMLSMVGEGGAGPFSAVVGWVGTLDGPVWSGAAGRLHRGSETPITEGTRFDLASLTKPFTATLALRLDALGELSLAIPLEEVWPGRVPRPLAPRRLGDLLRHQSFLAAWTPLYHRCRNRREALDLLLSPELLTARLGTYSDLGYILWGLAAEERLGLPVAQLLREHVLDPLGMEQASPSPGKAADVAACGLDTGKEVELAREQGLEIEPLPAPERGRVQDGNARFLAGHAAHAGLFASTADLIALAGEWLRPGRVLSPAQVERALSAAPGTGLALRRRRVLGWERRRVRGSSGPALSPAAFGHTGFTGGSLWIDPEQESIFVLLGHRVSPDTDLTQARRRFHRLGQGVLR